MHGVLAAATFVLAACGGGGGSSPINAESAQVRTVNALDDAAVATLSSGTQTVNAADMDTPVSEFAKVSDNAPMSLAAAAEGSSAQAQSVDAISSAISVPMAATKGDKITVFAMGDSSAVRTMHIKQNSSDVPAGQTGVRVLHAAPRVPAVDIYASAPGTALPATPTIAALAFANFAPPPNQSSLKVPQGNYYTVYAIGRASSAGGRPVRLILSRDSKSP